ncbi:WASH complex subunit 3-like isoform X2 [Macadamia integrifolia]|uniref:WASH complex subunit 3-like isoform X2 n=1 Tax=Macadamia integrifolia TaxID=60698 RepID=UPI001C4E712D|nr:WASH complex subunit 3-like isoform X2 [Macadamia integrifolia]
MMPWTTASRNTPPARSPPPFPAIDEFHNLRQQQQNLQKEEAALFVSDQRTLYLVNIFIMDTTRFLNHFSALCEEKLVNVHRRMLRLDSSLTLLEEQLRSSYRVEETEGHCVGRLMVCVSMDTQLRNREPPRLAGSG